ncbi:MAG: hypothetical protein JWM31_138 [Solirubrobacterales bacterium]|nr:hypothetical protein [Solirubrobacterales bacterium]
MAAEGIVHSVPVRPAADVVVPVAASSAGLRAVLLRMRAITLRPGDTLTVVDNRAVRVEEPDVLRADAVRTSYFARNAGAARGHAPWIVFLDADVHPPVDLLDRLLAPAPAPSVGLLAGGVEDDPVGPRGPVAARFAELHGTMKQASTLHRGRWAFAKTAHAAVRREAFAAVGGFRAGVRSGGDADLCWRLRAAGWTLEDRPEAVVRHASRTDVAQLLRQHMRHGSGAGWLQAEHPGSFPPRRWPGLVRWGLTRAASGLAAAGRGDRDGAVLGLLDGPTVWAFELGRYVPNRPARQRR